MNAPDFNNINACEQDATLVKYTLFPDAHAYEKVDRSTTWGAFVKTILAPHEYESKAACPLLSFSTYGDKLTTNGCVRSIDNMLEVHGVECDYDGEVMPIATAVETLRLWGFRAVLYTSASHTEVKPRWRVVLPLSRPHLPAERAQFVAQVNGLLASAFKTHGVTILDKGSFSLSQSFFFGKVSGVEYAAHEVKGTCIDTHIGLEEWEVYATAGAGARAGTGGSGELGLYDDQPPVTAEQVSDLRSALDHLAGHDFGAEYPDWQRVGEALKGESKRGESEQLRGLWLEYSRACGGFKSESDVLQKWKQLGGDRSGKGVIFKLAADLGWINPATARAGFENQLAQTLPNPHRYKLLSGADLHSLPDLEWLVRGVLPTTGIAALFGPSGSGKSFLAVDMAAAVAEGVPWFGMRVQQCPVVYAALEGEAGIKQRAHAWEVHHGRDLPTALQMMLQPFKLTTAQDVKDLAAVVPAGAALFLDTLNRAAPTSDENNSKDMGEIVEAAKALQRLTGGLVIVVHHTGKNTAAGLRGHSSLPAALDASVEVARTGDSRSWSVSKSKDGQDGNEQHFSLEQKNLSVDKYGDSVTSCVVVPALKPLKVNKPLTVTQQLAMKTFDALNDAGKGVHRRVWQESFCKHSTTSNHDAKRKAFNRAVSDLVGQGGLAVNDDVFRVPAHDFF